MNPNDILQYVWSGLSFILMLTVLVAVHEYGHFLFARMFGMRVKAFAVFIGGLREKGVVEGHYSGSLLPSRLLWLIGPVSVAILILFAHGPLFYVAFAMIGLVIPVWVASRIAALYHFSLARTLQIVSYPVGLGVIGCYFAGRSGNVLLALMLVVAWVCVLTLYYQPVLHKEESAEMGAGSLDIDGQHVAVPFRAPISTHDKKGTEYSLLMLPLGGFAAIAGMEPDEDGSEWKVEGGYFSKPPFARFMAIFAGPLFSFLLGSVLLTASLMGQGRMADKPNPAPVIGGVASGRAADKAGLQPGDRIVSIDGQPINSFYDAVKYVRDRSEQPIRVGVRRGTQDLALAMTPEKDKEPTAVLGPDMEPTTEKKIQGKIGIAPDFPRIPVTFKEAATAGFTAPYRLVSTFVGMLVTKPKELASGVGGITSVAAETHAAAKEGIWSVVELAGMLSMTLGMMNLLPIFPLDGGRMVLTLWEWARGNKRVDLRVQQAISTVGVMLILLLFIVVTTMDISRFSK